LTKIYDEDEKAKYIKMKKNTSKGENYYRVEEMDQGLNYVWIYLLQIL